MIGTGIARRTFNRTVNRHCFLLSSSRTTRISQKRTELIVNAFNDYHLISLQPIQEPISEKFYPWPGQGLTILMVAEGKMNQAVK